MDPSTSTSDLPTVMLVDDDVDVLDGFRRVVGRLGCSVTCFSDPVEAMRALDDGETPYVLIADKHMPGVDGLQLVQHAMEVDPSTVTILVTGQGDVQSAVEALRLGVGDYLLKPVEVGYLEFAVQRALRSRAEAVFHRQHHGRLRDEVIEKTAELELQNARLEALTVASLSGLVQLLEARSKYYQGHSQAVSRLAEDMARELGLSEEEIVGVRVAGLLLDIGMIAVPDAVINKSGTLTPADLKTLREHPRLAERVLRPFTHLGVAVDYVLSHHERLDGSGYPEGLFGNELAVGAEVLGAADMYTALVESRPHREALRPREALWTLRGAEGMWFSRRVLEALEAATGVKT